MLSTTATAIAGVAGTVIVLLTALGLLLYRQITRPLIGMQTAMSEIATSQDFTRRVPVGRMDEIGHSIVAFNGMIEIRRTRRSSSEDGRHPGDAAEHAAGDSDRRRRRRRACGYSAYLETIFETNDIAGRDLMALVFDDSNIGSDARSQVDAAVHAMPRRRQHELRIQ